MMFLMLFANCQQLYPSFEKEQLDFIIEYVASDKFKAQHEDFSLDTDNEDERRKALYFMERIRAIDLLQNPKIFEIDQNYVDVCGKVISYVEKTESYQLQNVDKQVLEAFIESAAYLIFFAIEFCINFYKNRKDEIFPYQQTLSDQWKKILIAIEIIKILKCAQKHAITTVSEANKGKIKLEEFVWLPKNADELVTMIMLKNYVELSGVSDKLLQYIRHKIDDEPDYVEHN